MSTVNPDILTLTLSATIGPSSASSCGCEAGSPTYATTTEYTDEVTNKVVARIKLASTASPTPTAVSLQGMTGAAFVKISVLGENGIVRARLTTTQGSTQSVPVDPHLVLVSASDPVTALDLLQPANTECIVEVILAEHYSA